jgi:hypothetical protein
MLWISFTPIPIPASFPGRCPSPIGSLTDVQCNQSKIHSLIDCAQFAAILSASNTKISFISYKQDGGPCEWSATCDCQVSDTCLKADQFVSEEISTAISDHLMGLQARGDTGPSILNADGVIVGHSHKKQGKGGPKKGQRRRSRKSMRVFFGLVCGLTGFGLLAALMIGFWDEIGILWKYEVHLIEEELPVLQKLIKW